MKHIDFGHIDGPIVLFGGAYSNVQALEALFDVAGESAIISTGDILGYCADPVLTVTLYRTRNPFGIAGNCERQIEEDSEDCGCGFGAGSACDLLSRGWYPFLRKTANDDVIAVTEALPDIGSFMHRGLRYAVIHGGATSVSRFIWPSTPEPFFIEEIAAIEAAIGIVDGVVAGHSGIAFQRMIGRHHWINAGAIGLPPHDGRPETRYCVLENGEVIFHRLSYDHTTAKARMEAAGLTQGYQDTLITGLWPSEDVLPSELRR